MSSVDPLAPADHRAAAVVLADAFLDDPGWVAVGPRSSCARWTYNCRTCLGTIRAGARWCGPWWYKPASRQRCSPAALRDFGAAAARRAAASLPGPVLAGRAPLVRSLGAQRVIEAAHPDYEHFLVWTFAVSPEHQRRGLGRRLMHEALAQADSGQVPAYLWTGNPANVPYCRSHGFEVIGETPIPGGVPNWFMQREPCPLPT